MNLWIMTVAIACLAASAARAHDIKHLQVRNYDETGLNFYLVGWNEHHGLVGAVSRQALEQEGYRLEQKIVYPMDGKPPQGGAVALYKGQDLIFQGKIDFYKPVYPWAVTGHDKGSVIVGTIDDVFAVIKDINAAVEPNAEINAAIALESYDRQKCEQAAKAEGQAAGVWVAADACFRPSTPVYSGRR